MNWAILTTVLIFVLTVFFICYKMAKAPSGVMRRSIRDITTLEQLRADLKDFIAAETNEDLTSGAFARLSQSEIDKREIIRETLRINVLECGQGDPNQRLYVKRHISDVLQKNFSINEKNIGKLIPFYSPDKMSAEDKFEYMYAIYKRMHPHHTFRYMNDDFDFFKKKEKPNGGHYYEVTAADIDEAYDNCKYSGNMTDKLECLTQRLYQSLYGHGVADIFTSDYSFDDIEGGVGGALRSDFDYLEDIRSGNDEDADSELDQVMYYDVLSVKYKGKLARMSFLSFGTPAELSRITNIIYLNEPSGTLSELCPKVQSKLKDEGSSRVMVTCKPLTNVGFYVRHPASSKALHLTDLINEWEKGEVLGNRDIVIKLLPNLVKGEFNIVISGNTGGGKTTLLKALVGYLDPAYEIRTVESDAELNLNNIFKDKNVHALIETANHSIYDCVADTKKMNTDVLIVGEVNEPKLSGIYAQANESGTALSMTTMHPISTYACICYIRNGLVTYCGITDMRIAEEMAVAAVNFDIRQVHDKDGHHYIEHISEVVPYEYEDYPEDINENDKEFHKRMTDRKVYYINRIIEFDRQNHEYHVVGDLSKRSYERLAEKIGIEATKELKMLLTSNIVDKIDYSKLLEDELEIEKGAEDKAFSNFAEMDMSGYAAG